jgi:hypothetical protein
VGRLTLISQQMAQFGILVRKSSAEVERRQCCASVALCNVYQQSTQTAPA